MKKVLTIGTFDILHEGHLDLFKQARKYGDYLICAVSHDKTVKRVKNHEPLNTQEKRMLGIESTGLCDEVIAAKNVEDKYEIIREIDPDIICLGYDQRDFTEKVHELGKEIIRLKPYHEDKFKSSILKKGL